MSRDLETSNDAQLRLDPGHGYTMLGDDDLMGTVNDHDHQWFGPDPAKNPNFQHLSTDATTTPDGVHRDAATQHADYPRPGSDGHTLRTSGYNMATIIAGLPQLAVYQ